MQHMKISQLVVQIGLLLCSISDGFIFGQMSGMVDALLGDDHSVEMTPEEVSLMAALINITCIGGYLLVGIITEISGRRRPITFLAMPLAICWIVVFYTRNKVVLLMTRVVVGISFGGILSLCIICVGEYTPPNMRPLSLNLVLGVGGQTGCTLGHVLSIFFNWRTVALIGLVPTMLSCIMTAFWVESPSWLASKGRFQECQDAYKSLHVMNQEKETELEKLIAFEKLKNVASKETNSPKPAKKLIWACKQMYLWKIILLSTMLNVYRVAAGRMLFYTMALTIFKELTGYSNLLMMTLLIDGFGIIGAMMSCVLMKLYRIRSLLLLSATLGNVLLIALSIVLYYYPNVDDGTGWCKAILLALYLVIVNSGPYPATETLYSEIFPLEAKSFCIFIIGIISSIMQFLAILLAQHMFQNIGYSAVFMINALIVFISLGYLWIFLPDTKDKTLQEIELLFKKDSNFDTNDLRNDIKATDCMLEKTETTAAKVV
ncbi:facilitated trehalose transporter Tret1-like isoform X2 [Leptidea sinapis]|uniref:facilitated trehalose transporter Tret1-like isoform X2 n=1 Tax=Leptidea sinapis TaxID=189913 RepID=UPI00212402FC|nr:facilitated trehalose transporter Tret1-like isoform X2 [Leptidea sinapis]